jgi:NAD(P)-dependent dehydrogenase (short-subunit alcohol dehydrogenase family)
VSIQRERVALVTGLTSGIGREVAKTLAGAGARDDALAIHGQDLRPR